MKNRARPELRYALKINGFKKNVVSSEALQDTQRIQWILGSETPYVVSSLGVKELQVTLDECGNVTDVYDMAQGRLERDALILQLILMEKLEKLFEKDRFRNVFLMKPELGTEEEVLRFALEIGQAIRCAHQSRILHRDVKLENIFWDEQKQIYKLGDFGMARQTEAGLAETVIYTDGYGAPEIKRRLYENYSAAADIYSFGITLYLLLNEMRFPGSGGYYPKVEVQYHSEYCFPAPVNASAEMVRVIRKMCSFYPEDRYQSMDEVLSALLDVGHSEDVELSTEFTFLETETYREENVENDTETVSGKWKR